MIAWAFIAVLIVLVFVGDAVDRYRTANAWRHHRHDDDDDPRGFA